MKTLTWLNFKIKSNYRYLKSCNSVLFSDNILTQKLSDWVKQKFTLNVIQAVVMFVIILLLTEIFVVGYKLHKDITYTFSHVA